MTSPDLEGQHPGSGPTLGRVLSYLTAVASLTVLVIGPWWSAVVAAGLALGYLAARAGW